ncbi:hypothetical protein [Sinorhizobium terangae]|uniref:hypothetical protein n=1 Tax=Sinorhizobium terangae TaxID=110322 RepID=UPI0017F85D8E|nr:hypothetical protein [Sinorhizobium terangae]MBB4187198.1 hypothetical protein [Sinorhizobium terangae]WFU50106.1 hypothetical protein QA637_25230 [Sinorhizobium terangae]
MIKVDVRRKAFGGDEILRDIHFEMDKVLDSARLQAVDAENRHFPLYCRRRHLP